jgi:cyclophilin family peptidyl-prolyl cis-trans isomerase
VKLSKFSKPIGVFLLVVAALTVFSLAVLGMIPGLITAPLLGARTTNFDFKEGPVLTPTVTVGPFDLHRRYRSMEGPFVSKKIRIGDLIAAQNAVIPENMVLFKENGFKSSMSGGAAGTTGAKLNLPDTSERPPQLFWLKGFKLEVLDENGNVAPTAEFICHFNLDVDCKQRNQIYTEAERSEEARILTITQGQTEVTFPEGYGVPVSTNEKWRFLFQAANRTTDAHRRIKHRLTIYLIPDNSLVEPITALNWCVPWVNVVVDKNTEAITEKEKSECPLCYGTSRGVTAPNATSDSVETDVYGRKITGHWVVPPGKHTWTSLAREPQLSSKDRLVHAVWSHIHPCCTAISLVKISKKDRKPMLAVTSRTINKTGLQIRDIDYINSKEGILLPQGCQYEIDISYNNTTGEPLDSMATMGVFYEDNEFARPKWVYDKNPAPFCGVSLASSAVEEAPIVNSGSLSATGAQSASSQTNNGGASGGADVTPVFDTAKDGPLLTQPRKIRLQTSDGPLTLQLEPRWAPKTATQMAKLFQNHVFDGTEIPRYEPNFVVQISLAECKAPGFAPMTVSEKKLVRRIPLEVNQQLAGQIKHVPGMLSMARQDNDTLDNTTSFSILIADAPHLDTKYTIFGRLTDDPENQRTLDKMSRRWPKHPYIVKTLSN